MVRLIMEGLIMKSIMVTYPEFRKLPKGLKQLLLASESFFFDQTKTAPAHSQAIAKSGTSSLAHERIRLGSLLHPAWKN